MALLWAYSIGASEHRCLRMVLNGGNRIAIVAAGAPMQGPVAKSYRAPVDRDDLEFCRDLGCSSRIWLPGVSPE